MNTSNEIWHPLGEQRWKELAEGTNCSDLQLRFAACRFGGMNASAAAKAAGYAGDKDSLRRAGYAALRSTAVQNLLELAAINAPTDAKITEKEIDAKLARLIRSGDPLTMLKATELHQKREAARREKALSDDDYNRDNLFDWRIERDGTSRFRNGATSYILIHGIHNLHLLHDTHYLVHREEFGPEIWRQLYDRLNDHNRASIDSALADPSYQLEVRKTVWAEIGKKPPGPLNSNAVDWRAKGLPNPNEATDAA